MAPHQHHVCITHPCEFCSVTGGNELPLEQAVGHPRVVPFPTRATPSWEHRIVARLAQLPPAQRAAVELLLDLYQP